MPAQPRSGHNPIPEDGGDEFIIVQRKIFCSVNIYAICKESQIHENFDA
jgi:hypothetical protein